MVQRCISDVGVGNLHFIMDRFKQNLISSVRNLDIADNFKFYQDNDPKHPSRAVKEWLLYNCRNRTKTPTQSRNINIINNLWHILQIKSRIHQMPNRDDQKYVLLEEWENTSSVYTRKLVESVPNNTTFITPYTNIEKQ